MKRRSLCGTVFGFLVAPLPGRAKQAVRRIGVLAPGTIADLKQWPRADEVIQ